MPSLTAVEAATRAGSISVTLYDVDLDLTCGEKTFDSCTRIEFASRDLADTFVDISPAELRSVQLNGQQLAVAELDDGRLRLTGLADSNVLVVDASMAYSHDGEGLHRAVDPEDGRVYVYAMTFLPAAPRIFACFDPPDLKAPYRFTVRAPDDWTVLGNGAATRVEPGAWSLAETLPLSTYFATLVAGPYHSITREHDGIPLGLHCRQSLAAHLDKDADELFGITAACFDEYHRLFGIRYPFGGYHQAFVPEFNAGAMENPGCVTFTDELVFKAQATASLRGSRAMVVAHEMAHQWFGDLVTMRWWDDLWLNESFAELMGYRVTSQVTEFSDVLMEFALNRKALGLAADQRSSTHPVAGNGARDADEALTNFDGISYTKGAAVLRQLNAYLGDEAFLAGVVDHLTRHAYGNAEFADLVRSWEEASGKDVSTWAGAWLRTAGVDTLAAELDSAGHAVITRRTGSAEPLVRPHAITVTAYDRTGAPTATPLVVTESTTDVPLKLSEQTMLVLPDSADQTWAKIGLDEKSVRAASQALQVIDDQLARAVIWGALREGMLDGNVSPEQYVAALEQALPAETDMAVEVLLTGALNRLGTYLSISTFGDRLASLADRLLTEAQPGSNRQLVAARTLIDVTGDTDRLERWLDADVPTGLLVDDDLRWRVLVSLCAAGAKGTTDIEALQRRDKSSQGALHALRSRASRPTPAAKEEAWRSLTTNPTLSNYELYALAEGFFRPDQVDVTAPYVQRYFTEIPDTASIRSGWVVERMTLLAYPRFAADAATVTLADRCLARDDLDAGVRRSVSDRTDDLRRLLLSRGSRDR